MSKSNWSKLKTIKPCDVQGFNTDAVDSSALVQAREIVCDVQQNGEDAMLRHAVRLGDLESLDQQYVFGKEDLRTAFESLSESDRMLLLRTGENIRKFAEAQLQTIRTMEIQIEGGVAGQDVRVPVSSSYTLDLIERCLLSGQLGAMLQGGGYVYFTA